MAPVADLRGPRSVYLGQYTVILKKGPTNNENQKQRMSSNRLIFVNAIFVSSHMYLGNPEETQVIVDSMNMGSDTARI